MILSIVNDFCETPGPRFKSEGNFSGEEFRDEILEPKFLLAKRNNEKLIIKLDGVYGYPVSFLEEAFGGLIREDHIPYDFLKRHLLIKSDEDDIYIQEINTYIEIAYKKESEKKIDTWNPHDR